MQWEKGVGKCRGVGEEKPAAGELSAGIQRHIRQRNASARVWGIQGVSASNNGDIISANKRRQEEIDRDRRWLIEREGGREGGHTKVTKCDSAKNGTMTWPR